MKKLTDKSLPKYFLDWFAKDYIAGTLVAKQSIMLKHFVPLWCWSFYY